MLIKKTRAEKRYFVRDPFNPSSPKQLLEYMAHMGHSGGRNHKAKTDAPSTDEQTLSKLARKDPFYKLILSWRRLGKLDSTYATGLLARADSSGRVHSTFGHRPSTWRLSSSDPNLQNIPTPEEGTPDLVEAVAAAEIRRAIIAQPGCVLVSADFAAIEAVITGYYCNDPDYMRLARYGIHSYLVSHKLGEPADLSWSDEALRDYLAHIKRKYHDTPVYRSLKKTVHGTNYGESAYAMKLQEPDLFASFAMAESLQKLYFDLCPKLKVWQTQTRLRADKQGFLGGMDHPYRFKHWFWDVTRWDPVKKSAVPSGDWNRCVAFYPQSTAAGVIFDAVLALSLPSSPWYVGDYFFGKTPLRALVHDEILAEVPEDRLDPFLERLAMAMKQPMPELKIGHDIKVGKNWADMEQVR
jgi:DNA polymerase-1